MKNCRLCISKPFVCIDERGGIDIDFFFFFNGLIVVLAIAKFLSGLFWLHDNKTSNALIKYISNHVGLSFFYSLDVIFIFIVKIFENWPYLHCKTKEFFPLKRL